MSTEKTIVNVGKKKTIVNVCQKPLVDVGKKKNNLSCRQLKNPS